MSSSRSPRESPRSISSNGTEANDSTNGSRAGKSADDGESEEDRRSDRQDDDGTSGDESTGRNDSRRIDELSRQDSGSDGNSSSRTSRPSSSRQSQQEGSDADEAASSSSTRRSKNATGTDGESEASERRPNSSSRTSTDGSSGGVKRRPQSAPSQSENEEDFSSTGRGESARSGSRDSARSNSDGSSSGGSSGGRGQEEASEKTDCGRKEEADDDTEGEENKKATDNGSDNGNNSSEDALSRTSSAGSSGTNSATKPKRSSSRIEKTKRRSSSHSKKQQEVASATKIQRQVRTRQARAKTGRHVRRRHKAATKIQATTRGRRERRKHQRRNQSATSQGETDHRFPTTVNEGSPSGGRRTPGSHGGGDFEIAGEVDHVASTGRLHSTSRPLTDEEREAAISDKKFSLATNHTVRLESDSRRTGRRSRDYALGEEDAARRIQRQVRRRSMARKGTRGGGHRPKNRDWAGGNTGSVVAHGGEGARVSGKEVELGQDGGLKCGRGARNRDGEILGKDEAARRIQRTERRRQGGGRVSSQRQERNDSKDVIGEDVAARRTQSRVRRWNTKGHEKKHFTSANEPSANDRDGFTSSSHEEYAALSLTARSPSPSRRHQQPRSWMSPGKAAATAATAAAQEAARAAAASVKAAEAAADAAEAAEAAAEAEEESQQSQSTAFRSPPPTISESRRHPSPARSAFWVTDGNKGGAADHGHAGGSSPKSRTPRLMDDASIEGGTGRAEEHHARGVRRRGEAGEDHGSSGRGGVEEEMLKRAREQQARRHARERRARAMAKEQESKRELQAVQAELVKAEARTTELRERQAMAEKSALEAKRARVMEDMKRRQQRLQRLQEEEGLLRRRGDSRNSSPSRSRSADPPGNNGKHGQGAIGGGQMGEEGGGGATAVSLPPLESGGGLGDARARRKPRHVSTFRERILEERRLRKEARQRATGSSVDVLKRKEVEEKHTRQADYAAKIRAQARRALAAEQRRAREDADWNARRSGCSQSAVDRTPIAIKRPKREGEWGVFSYAPDRPTDKTSPKIGRGRPCDSLPAESGFGSTGRVHGRLRTSELVDRMRKERARATEASRARAAAAAARGGSRGGTHDIDGTQDGTGGYGYSEPNGTAPPGGDGGDQGRGGHEVEMHPRRPSRGGGAGSSSGRANAARRYQGEQNRPPPPRQNRPAATGRNIHAMYEERLATLERRLGEGGEKRRGGGGIRRGGGAAAGGEQVARTRNRVSNAGGNPSGGSGSDGAHVRRTSGGAETKSTREEGEWGAENNPFGYRKLSRGDEGPGSIPSSGVGGERLVNSRRGSEASGGDDVEGLSTMYMGPITHKMAELRAGNG
ncbi:unnamed protein product [Ectocarpus sp. 12 AP-2014]